jgi:hypothetical protein
MIRGAHVILYSRDAVADRAFLRDVLGMPAVDAGDGWLIFRLPPAEVAVHPADASGAVELTRAGVRSEGPITDSPKNRDRSGAACVRAAARRGR